MGKQVNKINIFKRVFSMFIVTGKKKFLYTINWHLEILLTFIRKQMSQFPKEEVQLSVNNAYNKFYIFLDNI